MTWTMSSTLTFQHISDVRMDSEGVTMEAGPGFKPWDNPYNLMDQTTSQTTETVINVGVLPIVVVVGVITNVINMIIYARQGLQDRINVCLFSLALADCGYLLALIIYKSFNFLALFSKTLGNFWKIRSLNTILGVYWGFSIASNLLTLLVSVERCLCVVSPLRAKRLLKTKVMVVLIVLIYVLILSSSLIFNAKYTVIAGQDEGTNTTIYRAVFSEFYLQNKLFVDIVFYNVLITTLPCCSFLVVILCTGATVIFLRRALAWKQTSAHLADAVNKKETAVTKMLLLVCYAYVFFMAPTVLNGFLVQFVPGWDPSGRYVNSFYVYVAMMHLCGALNSSLNFFIYYFRGSKFRGTLRQLGCG